MLRYRCLRPVRIRIQPAKLLMSHWRSAPTRRMSAVRVRQHLPRQQRTRCTYVHLCRQFLTVTSDRTCPIRREGDFPVPSPEIEVVTLRKNGLEYGHVFEMRLDEA